MNFKNNLHSSPFYSIPAAAPRYFTRAVVVALASLLCYGSISSTSAQEAITGQWIIEPDRGKERRADSVHLTIQRSQNGRGNFNSTDNVKLENFRGLTQTQMAGSGSAVQFQIVRDAGVLNCEGWFKDGRGSGHFTFAPDGGFASEMQGLGYGNMSEEKLFTLAVLDVGRAFIRELAALGYDRLPVDNLVAMKIHGATPQFISELRAVGYDHPAVDQLIAMRIHGAIPEFIRDLQAEGYNRPPIDQLVAMRIHGVSTDFIKELKQLGYDQVPVEQLVAMRIHGVSAAFIQKMKDRGLKDLSVEELVRLRIHGFDKEL
ncbi:MAG TPA: hypothetical protein VNI02_01300 [Blastocatellia bacterium]|jgi:hypothetical protein|nr:hypothetical protein [Blastocatellia bacterium]